MISLLFGFHLDLGPNPGDTNPGDKNPGDGTITGWEKAMRS